MFNKLNSLFTKLFSDIQSTFIWLFIIGLAICGLFAAWGSEEMQPKFKRGFVVCLIGLTVFLLAKYTVDYFQTNLR